MPGSATAAGKTAQWDAAQPNQVAGPLDAVGHGAFTYFAIGAMRGWADGQVTGERDGVVTSEEAQLYVDASLKAIGIRDQDPSLVGATAFARTLASGAKERAPVLDAAVQAPAPLPPVVVPRTGEARVQMDGKEERPLTAFMPSVVPPQSGLDYVGAYQDPGGLWRGVEVTGIRHDWPEAAVVCATKDGAPVIGFGGDVPVADSAKPGTPIRYCPAARVGYTSIFVPSGTVLEIARPDPSGVYIVESVYRCDVSSYFSGRVQAKGALGCAAIRR